MTDSPVEPTFDDTPVGYVPSKPVAEPVVGAQKAILGGIVSFVITFAGALQVAIASGADLGNWLTWLNVALVAIVGGGGTSATVYQTSNKVSYR